MNLVDRCYNRYRFGQKDGRVYIVINTDSDLVKNFEYRVEHLQPDHSYSSLSEHHGSIVFNIKARDYAPTEIWETVKDIYVYVDKYKLLFRDVLISTGEENKFVFYCREAEMESRS